MGISTLHCRSLHLWIRRRRGRKVQTCFSSNCAATRFSCRALVCTAYQFNSSGATPGRGKRETDSKCICEGYTASPSQSHFHSKRLRRMAQEFGTKGDDYLCNFAASLDPLIRPATSRDARSDNVLNKNPFPVAENPLRLFPARS